MINKKALIEFFKISPTPSLVVLPNAPVFTIIEVNNTYLEVTNSKREDLVGKGIFEAFPEDENDPKADGVMNLNKSLNTVVITKKSHKMALQKYDIPIRGTSKFELKYWKPENIPLLNEEGELDMIIHTVMDVTESILANQKIEEAKLVIDKGNEILQQTEAISRLGRWDYDLTTGKIYWSDSCYILIGYRPQEFEMNMAKIIDIVHPDDLERRNKIFEQALKEKKDYNIELRFITKNKSIINVVIRGVFIYDTEGNPKKIVGIIQDITDMKAAEAATKKAIQESNERFEYVAKATFDAIWDWDLVSDTIYWGDGFEKIFNHKISDIEANTSFWEKNIHPEDIQRITDNCYTIIKSTETNWIEEYRFKNGDGSYSHVINKGIVIRNHENRVIRIIGAMHDITKQKQEEQRLKLLESVITNTTDAVVIKEANPSSELGRKIVFVNKSFTQMSGYTKKEIVGQTHRLLQGPNSDKVELAKFYKALDELKPIEITIINYKKSGKEFWVNMSLNPVFNDKGEHTHWVSIERDVTEKKIVEEELLKRLKEISDYKYAIDESSIVAITNQKGIITHVNDNFCKISKYSREELLGQDHRIINSNYHSKEFIKQLWTTIANGKVWKGELKNRAKDGTPYWVDTTIVPFLNEEGKPYQYVAIRSDITERKKQDQKLVEMSQKLSDALESIRDGFYTLDNDWNVSYWNHEAERISGISKQEMIGKNFWKVNEGRISKTIYSKFHYAKKQNKPIRLEVFSKSIKNWFELNAFPSSMGLTIYFKDINERKNTESKLRKMNRDLEAHVKELAISNEELEQFAYVASHDLQEPLRMITGFLTQIEKKYEDLLDEKGKKYIFFAVDGAKRMRQIILDLLEFSRIGKTENKLEEIHLNEIVDEVVLLYKKQIEEKRAKINYQNLPKIKAYLVPIKQIFQNLISNSLKYSKSGSSPVITITSQETALNWEFKIRDNGIGINPEYFEKIFIIFQRLHNKDDYSGTGMGLSITKKIIDNLGGSIWLESEEGVGTTFHFTIPKKQTKRS